MKKNLHFIFLSVTSILLFQQLEIAYAQTCLTTPPNLPPATCETPGSIECVYGISQNPHQGCPIKGAVANQTGGWGAIAVVDVLDNACIQNDLDIFSSQFNLPNATITYIYAAPAPSDQPLPGGCPSVLPVGSQPDNCFDHPTANEKNPCNEHVLDVEWVHAMAPRAQIFVVEAPSGKIQDKMYAACYAARAVEQAGGGLVSMSFSDPEFAQETGYDIYFQGHPHVLFISSSGDYSAPARYPSTSPYVISAGGSSIKRDAQGMFIGETAWSTDPNIPMGSKNGGSGGPSIYESRPSYQNTVMKIVGTKRGTPDISFDADPKTGVCVYSSLVNTGTAGWMRTGGTSASAPALAGIINTANHRANSSFDELTFIYNNAIKNYHSYWRDVLQGNNGFRALAGYDFTTGLGTPISYTGK